MKKKILVLGSTGQDGSFICKLLVKKNFDVYGLARKSATGNLKNLHELTKLPNFKICHGDLLDLISIERIIREIKPHEIYNFADQDHV
jgi:GDPmannose 4,6-dehydratase